MPLPGIVAAIREPRSPTTRTGSPTRRAKRRRRLLAEPSASELGLSFEPADIALTTGAFAAIMVAFRLVLDVGDEADLLRAGVVLLRADAACGRAVPRKVALKPPTFDLDLDAIEAAIGPSTRLVIVNTPHNPTGRIYARADLKKLADILERASPNRPAHLPALG